MDLNACKAEAKAFLASIGALQEGAERKLEFLEEEYRLLQDAVRAGEPGRIGHQIYDMLFALFELAAVYDVDLCGEWNRGRERKRAKYM